MVSCGVGCVHDSRLKCAESIRDVAVSGETLALLLPLHYPSNRDQASPITNTSVTLNYKVTLPMLPC